MQDHKLEYYVFGTRHYRDVEADDCNIFYIKYPPETTHPRHTDKHNILEIYQNRGRIRGDWVTEKIADFNCCEQISRSEMMEILCSRRLDETSLYY